MTGLVRACRLAAAFVLSLSVVPAAHAAPNAAALTQAGNPAGAPLSLASPPATARVAGSFQAPAVPAAQPQTAPLAAARAPIAPAVTARSLDQLVAGFTTIGELDSAGICLAKAVYFEARGESLEGQLAVAKVVLNRAASGTYPGEVCAVVTQKAQFSFVRRGRLPQADEGSESWRRAVAIAHIARNALARSVPENVLWYHANYVSPSWGRRLTKVTRIGTHIFYS
jgi:spore germination cell wall hydrolase CwlJ-like protein